MNAFGLDRDYTVAAQLHNDKHVVKMNIEYPQLMSTAHRVLDGEEYYDRTKNNRRIKRWRLDDVHMENTLYKASHINHPCGMKEVMQLRHESNRIKLIATQEMLSTLNALESLTDQAMKHSNEFMNNFVKVVSENRQDLVASYQEGALALGGEIKSNTDKLMEQMRREIGAV